MTAIVVVQLDDGYRSSSSVHTWEDMRSFIVKAPPRRPVVHVILYYWMFMEFYSRTRQVSRLRLVLTHARARAVTDVNYKHDTACDCGPGDSLKQDAGASLA